MKLYNRTNLAKSLLLSFPLWSLPLNGAILVNLDATALPLGPLPTWINTGTIAGNFNATGSPGVTSVAGLNAVTLEGGSDFYAGPPAGGTIAGAFPQRSIEVWAHNPSIAGEETLVAWGRRGGGEGTNMAFNYGNNASFGAVGHWGGGPDLGWNNAGGAPTQGAWHYLVYTYDDSTTRVYSDGVLQNSEASSLATHADLPFVIGGQNNDQGVPAGFNSGLSIARVRIHDTVLSDGDISTNYTTERSTLFLGATLDGTRVVSTSAVAFTLSDIPPASVTNPGTFTVTAGGAVAHWTVPGGEGILNGSLTTPTLLLPNNGPVTLTLKHRYNIEGDNYDGAVVQVSVNGGPFNNLETTNFSQNGYNAGPLIGNNVLIGQLAWGQASLGFSAGAKITSIATIPDVEAGDEIDVRFLGAWDEGFTPDGPDWEIYGVKVTAGGAVMIDENFSEGNGGFSSESTAPGGAWNFLAGDQPVLGTLTPSKTGNTLTLTQAINWAPGRTYNFTIAGQEVTPWPSASAWTVLSTLPGGLIVSSLPGADAAVDAAVAADAAAATSTWPQINFSDPQGAGSGRIPGDAAWPRDTADDDNKYAMRMSSTLNIPVSGSYLIGFQGDDGSKLTVGGTHGGFSALTQNATNAGTIGRGNTIAANLGSLGAAVNFSPVTTATWSQAGAIANDPNTAVSTTGGATRLRVPLNTNLNPATAFSVELWAKPSTVPGGLTCVCSSGNFANPRMGWLIYMDPVLGWNFRGYNGLNQATVFNISTGGVPVAGNWYHIVATWSGSEAIIYVNGVASAPASGVTTYVPATTSLSDGSLTVGARADNAFAWSGLVDELAIYPAALDLGTIDAHKNNAEDTNRLRTYQSLILEANPLGYWRLGESLQPFADLGTITTDVATGDSSTVGRIFLEAGTYPISATFWEDGGGSSFEIFASPDTPEAAFQALGPATGNPLSYTVSWTAPSLPFGAPRTWPVSLPGPLGTANAWGVRTYLNEGLNGGDNLTAALDFLAASADRTPALTPSNVIDTAEPSLNFVDPATNGGGGGIVSGDRPFPADALSTSNNGGVNRDDNYVVTSAHGVIQITEAADYTFNLHGDDGFMFRIKAASGPHPKFAAVGGAGSVDLVQQNVLYFASGTGDHNTRGVVRLTPGTYKLEYVTWEGGGGFFYEVSAAKGFFLNDSDTTAWRATGYQVTPYPSASAWTVLSTLPGGLIVSTLPGADAAVDAAIATDAAAATSTWPQINFFDPQSGGTGRIPGDVPWPRDTAADDNKYAMRMSSTLNIPVSGSYLIGFQGDDGTKLTVGGTHGGFSALTENATNAGTIGRTKLVINNIGSLAVPSGAALRSGLVNYWNFDNNLTDQANGLAGTSSSVADNGTFAGLNGTDGISFGTGLFGAATNQNGAGGGAAGQENDGFVRVARSTDTLFGANATNPGNLSNVTTSMWINVAGFDTGWQTAISHGEGAQYRIARRGGSDFVAYAGGVGEGAGNGPSVAAGTGWHHLVATSQGGVNTKFWVNGTLIATGGAPNINDAQGNSLLNLNIGANPDTGNNNREWFGSIDDVAQWNRVLSDSEIAQIYGGGSATAQSLGGLLIPEPATGAPAGNSDEFSSVIPGVPGAIAGDSNTAISTTDVAGNKVTVPWVAGLNPASPAGETTAFSVEAWVKPATSTGAPQTVVNSMIAGTQQNPANGNDRSGYNLRYSNDGWQFILGNEKIYCIVLHAGGTVTVGEWQHIVATFDGTTARLYKNGAQIAVGAIGGGQQPGGPAVQDPTGIPKANYAAPLYIGKRGFGDWRIDGAVDEVAIYGAALDEGTINSHADNGVDPNRLRPYSSLVLASSPLAYYRLGEPSSELIDTGTIFTDVPTGNSSTVGRIFLEAGTYPISATFWEDGGGSYIEIFASPDTPGAGFRAIGPAAVDVPGLPLVTHPTPTPAPPTGGLVVLPGGALSVTFASVPYATYTLESSTDMVNWVVINNDIRAAATGGSTTYTGVVNESFFVAPTDRRAYYRIIPNP